MNEMCEAARDARLARTGASGTAYARPISMRTILLSALNVNTARIETVKTHAIYSCARASRASQERVNQ